MVQFHYTTNPQQTTLKTSKIEEILSMKVYRVIVANIVLIGETVHYEIFHNIKATMLR